MLHRARERIASSSSSVVCSAFTAARPLPHCQRHAVEMGLILFFVLISLHFFVCVCSDCILLQLVAVEIKAGFFFSFLGSDLISEKDCIL